ncbi:MAG: cyclic nucleotide-binding domain-containing protein [Microscillaceae bacterium]|nr:cyclic nucleotide-binding domain-containing protein [Microscillaceae bacterium]MDW8461597.1 cyclic nucleotide-binding domain-containing protein [Cytophagales bacterium]
MNNSTVANLIEAHKVAPGIYWVEIPEAKLYILCGCPADAVKHLKKRGLIAPIEKDGVKFETGPNVILLSDLLTQNGNLSNLSEFPVLQMLYLQGLLIPNHPNNTGTKPLLIGNEKQLKAQMEYIFRGNYGLISKEEIMAADSLISEELAEEIMFLKLKFAFGKINTPDKLLDSICLGEQAEHIRNGVYIKRKDLNVFEFSYKEQSITIDLNLKPNESYEPPYYLGYHQIRRDYFAILHTGEGDAWDVHRPCMASIIIFQGKIYLIDAGPDLLTSLNALGISINEVAGIFNTHAHDDHFAGLTCFVRSDHRIKYYASPAIRSSVAKKLCALMLQKEEAFEKFFDVQDLKLNQWNDIDGLEVMPCLSPHPVETNIFFFRAFGEDRYYTYAHFADICALKVLKKMVMNEQGEGKYAYLYQKAKEMYLTTTDIKKVDIGGGMIHGEIEDFVEDKSRKILFAHTSRQQLTPKEQEIGTFAHFGSTDVLVKANYDFVRERAYKYLRFYFPTFKEHEIDLMLNSPILTISMGDILYKKGNKYEYVYLVLSGSVEIILDSGITNTLTAGSLLGFHIDRNDLYAKHTCKTTCYTSVLSIPVEQYLMLIEKHHLVNDFDLLEQSINLLSNTSLLSENISLPTYFKLAKEMVLQKFYKGEYFTINDSSEFYIIKSGKVDLLTSYGSRLATLEAGNFFGVENLFSERKNEEFEVFFMENSEVYQIPMAVILNIPIACWKLVEIAYQRSESLYY